MIVKTAYIPQNTFLPQPLFVLLLEVQCNSFNTLFHNLAHRIQHSRVLLDRLPDSYDQVEELFDVGLRREHSKTDAHEAIGALAEGKGRIGGAQRVDEGHVEVVQFFFRLVSEEFLPTFRCVADATETWKGQQILWNEIYNGNFLYVHKLPKIFVFNPKRPA